MLFTAPEQFIVLGLLLIGGWLLGFASAPSPKKWKRRAREQSDSFTAYHAEAEDRTRAATQRATDLQAELEAVRADHVEAERTIAALRAGAATAAVAAPVAVIVAEHPVPSVAEPEAISETVAEPIATEAAPATADEAATPAVEHLAEVVPAVPAIVEADHVAEAEAPATAEPVHAEAVVADTPAPETAAVTTPEPAESDPAIAAEVSAPEAVAITTSAPSEPEPAIEDAAFEPVAPVPMTPTATEAPPAPIGPAEPEMPSEGWFSSSARDELTRIRGIDDALNTRLFELGVVRFEDVEMLSAEDEMALEERLALPVGTIARDQWRAQAAFFRAGRNSEHAANPAPVEPAPVA